ncbi:hypothetical protein [Avibacterium sp. 21-599]|uniref:hypothetical protein n=1 Tax=Avibacterium sp. 21-599 TaxID=2911528 RepID=UPI002247A61A|nr:hypothetical protein [Avibacterium sp. 21-599]MCW9717447.1 hypothetical protein [Avibacterium sp. 21-599]
MKKQLFSIILATGLLVGCAELTNLQKMVVPANFKQSDLVNKKWYCSSSYATWNLLTKEYYTYSPNGRVVSDGTMRILKDGREFNYKIHSEGIWQLNGRYLFERATKASVTKNYSVNAKQALKANPKLAKWEKEMFLILKTMETSAKKGAIREIETLTPTELTTIFASSYVICAKQ